ncbi:MAG: hypothetical protein M3P82_03485 [Bacteroidota bacterium]|nr:hypothetical protein [Bacteroidota bacterium]
MLKIYKMPVIRKIYLILIVLICISAIQSCGKKEEPQTFIPPGQDSINKENERKAREEFERLRNEQNGITDTTILKSDSLAADTSKVQNTDKKKFVQKEKELNKRLDNPKNTITDYIELLKRGTTEGGNFDLNMKKASQQWVSANESRFKNNYKNTKKIIILEEPKITSQKGNAATVEVRIKKSDNVNSKIEDTEMTVQYNLVADSNGKWKIKDNIVVKK